MPIYLLSDEHPELFPPPERADKSGVLAVGGDLRPERLLAAYSRGIFPWYSEGDPILWHSPDPRFVLEPERLASSVKRFTSWGFQLIDCQVETEHLARFGAEPWPRKRFLAALARVLKEPTRRGKWTEAAASPETRASRW